MLPKPAELPAEETTVVAGAGVLEKAMHLLNIVSSAPAPMTFTELLRAGSLPKATLHRILATLTREGLLRHDPFTKTYRLGLRLLELAHEVWGDFDLRLAAQDELVRLRNAVRETVHLAVLDAGRVVLIAVEDAGRDVQPGSKVGMKLPVHATALGKVIVAYLDPARQLELLAGLNLTSYSLATMTNLTDLRRELDLTRARGYAIELDEYEIGTVAVAAPIFDIEGRPIGAVAVNATVGRVDAARAHALSSTLIGAARTISHNAGGQLMSIQPRSVPGPEVDFDVRCVAETRSLLGEGPTWSPRDGLLYWVDILTPSVHCYDTARGVDSESKIGSMVSAAIPKATGGLLVATPGGLMTLDLTHKTLAPFCHPEADRPGNRYNDGKCDRMGRLWIGTLDMGTAANRGNLYRVDPDGSWRKMDAGFTVANGLGWSPDNKHMYFTDTPRRNDSGRRRLPVGGGVGRLARVPLFTAGRGTVAHQNAGSPPDKLLFWRTESRHAVCYQRVSPPERRGLGSGATVRRPVLDPYSRRAGLARDHVRGLNGACPTDRRRSPAGLQPACRASPAG
jgi:DNA-binding IclR family transcriptional regulator